VSGADRAGARLRRIAAAATAGMLLLSWPLWLDGGEVPRVPFLSLAGKTDWPPAVSWVLFAGLVGATALAGAARTWRPWFAASVGLFVVLVLRDQHRFQPWVYQYAMTLLLLAALPGGEGLRYVRWWFVALYAHSGLSKLDVSFRDELGQVFLRAAIGPLGFDPRGWPPAWRSAAVLAMPAAELGVAVMLAVPGLRAVGRVGAAVLHLLLILILGPLGLGHSTIVLVWNAAMLAEVWVAFGAGPEGEREGHPWHAWLVVPVKLVFWAGVLLPFGERWGCWDAWPSHALYASHVGRVSVWLHESELPEYPAGVRGHVASGQGDGPWRRLDLTGWCRGERGTPVYPQVRACLGLAEGLAARYGGRGLVRVVVFGPADRWTGSRRSAEAVGLDAIRRLGDDYTLNAHPAGTSRRPGQGAPR
jgi:hypothetical protein